MAMDAGEIIRRFEQLKGERSTWEQHWQEIADYVIPSRGRFVGFPAGLTAGEAGGRKRHDRIFDDTAPWAMLQLAAGMQGMLTSPSIRWFQLKAEDERLNEMDSVNRWMEAVSDRLFAIFNSPRTTFASQAHELYIDLACFGTAAMLVDDQQGLRFQTRHLGECHIAENETGRIDTLYREYQSTAKQMIGFFGRDRLPTDILNAAETQPHQKFQLIHAVFPRRDMRGDRRFALNKPFASVYISRNHNMVLREGGFDEFPYLVPRWSKLVGERYGRSPAMTVLPTILMVNAMQRTIIVGAQKIVDPPLMVPSDGFINPIRTTPGSLNYYDALNQRGPDAMKPILTGGRPDIGEDMLASRQQAILRGFHVDWLNLRESPQMTATEILQRRDEQLRMLGPIAGRIQSEFLGPLINRTLKILERASRRFWAEGVDGPLPLPPDEIVDQEIDVEYVTPIGQAQKSVQVESIAQVTSAVERLSAFDQSLPGMVDAEATVREIHDVYNAPMDMLRSPEDVAAIRRRQAEEQAATANAQLGAEQADTALKLAQSRKAIADSRR